MANVTKDDLGGVLIPLDTLAGEINARFAKIERHETEAENHRIAAGKQLIEARRRVESGDAGEATWTSWCATHIDRSQRDIRKVMRLAGSSAPKAALEKERSAAREGMAKGAPRAG